MRTLGAVVLALVLLGVVLAVLERRRKRVFLAHDISQAGARQTEADRERIRQTDAARNHAAGFQDC